MKGDHPLQLQVEGLLPSMKSLRGGAMAIDRVLDIATGWALSEAQRQLNGGAPLRVVSGEVQGTEKECNKPPVRGKPPQPTWILENSGKYPLRVNRVIWF